MDKNNNENSIGSLIMIYMTKTGATFEETLEIFGLNRAKIENRLSQNEKKGIRLIDEQNSVATRAFDTKKPDSFLSRLLVDSQENGIGLNNALADGDKHKPDVDGKYTRVIKKIGIKSK